MIRTMCRLKLSLMVALVLPGHLSADDKPDAIIVGAGISGLSAALEAARGGKHVVIVEMSTVGGGHAVMSNGAVAMVGTPLQARRQIADSPKLAERDFLERGQNADRGWVARYARDSKTWLYDWFSELGVEFEFIVQTPGNSVPRLHLTRGKGIGLVEPLLRECLRHPNITFFWATKAQELVFEDGIVRGVLVRDLRQDQTRKLEASSVVVATGGFGSNLELVRRNWPEGEPSPPRLLVGASHFATASGHEMVRQAGGVLTRMDHLWSYVLGLPDPRDPKGERGLAAFNFQSIWVNKLGKRFMKEFGDPKALLETLLRQPDASYWSVFDADAKRDFSITLAGYDDPAEVSQLVYDSKDVVLVGETIEELARKMNVPAKTLGETIGRYNLLVQEGIDTEFGRFGPETSSKPQELDRPPFYAAHFFPITRKSMGGVAVDEECRVLTAKGRPIENLYAVGEVTGFGGINGRAALEGTFLGPGAYMGRLAGKRIAGQESAAETVALRPLPDEIRSTNRPNSACGACHRIEAALETGKPGYWHFEQSHAKVLDREYQCVRCHSGMIPFNPDMHKLDRLAQTRNCVACHGIAVERAAFAP